MSAPIDNQLFAEASPRRLDPYEINYLGVLRTNDPLLLERAGGVRQAMEICAEIKRDGKVFACLQRRHRTLVSYPWAVTGIGHEDEKSLETVRNMLNSIGFDTLCREMLDALVMGFTCHEIVWERKDGWVWPERIVQRAQRRFVFVDREGAPPELRQITAANMLMGEPLKEKKYLLHRQDPVDDNPYGNGLISQLYWPVFFKRQGYLSWVKMAKRFGSPIAIGKYPATASEQGKNTIKMAAESISEDMAATYPDTMQLELLESKLGGNITTQEQLIISCNNWIQEVILSQESTTNSGASASAAIEREDMRLALAQADADLLSDSINRQLLNWFCDLNGLQPCTVARIIKKPDDTKALSEVDKNVASLGFEPSEKYIQERYGEGWAKKQAPATTTPTAPASFAESTTPAAPTDFIDPMLAAIQSELGGWKKVVEPLVNPLQKVLDESAAANETAAQLMQRLSTVLSTMDDAELQKWVGKSNFLGRLIGLNGGMQ